MPHYADGTEAQVGDNVIGTGYNVKGTIVGRVIGVVPNTDACNIRVAYIKDAVQTVKNSGGNIAFFQYIERHGEPGVQLQIDIEYGATKDFTKVG